MRVRDGLGGQGAPGAAAGTGRLADPAGDVVSGEEVDRDRPEHGQPRPGGQASVLGACADRHPGAVVEVVLEPLLEGRRHRRCRGVASSIERAWSAPTWSTRRAQRRAAWMVSKAREVCLPACRNSTRCVVAPAALVRVRIEAMAAS